MLKEFSNDYIGMDSSIKETRFPDMKLVQTTDCFYPLIEDPYLMGKITCANVLSDLYAMGVASCDNMLMILGISEKLEENIKDTVTKLIITGFHDAAADAGTIVTGGQTIRNPWFLLGGVASTVVREIEIIRPVNAVAGDVLVLTKPLGTRPAVNAHVALYDEQKRNKLMQTLTEQEVIDCYNQAVSSMIRLNKIGAELMHKYDAHASTDVTGFGILGHANQLAKNTKEKVKFNIHLLPVFKHSLTIDNIFDYGLTSGRSAETSGGLLICMSAKNANMFIDEISELENHKAFVVGNVVKCTNDEDRCAEMAQSLKIIEI
ncbi:hypothetical protein BB559_006287 [Furculomyces boomerangus]|uniref:Selenide, water dikinase n=2 Tax=Harpellales TaxID=61421 RepID=A0A2T9Y3R3_9FUNG|nr:hypothetical protein BB559_006287 [Furculomyces boomerangus]PWA00039.1 hypothetical protein BB558_003872 [Smittium angustum]PWA02464.1 hypothetical protein BB558_001382 [Smittium angustum]